MTAQHTPGPWFATEATASTLTWHVGTSPNGSGVIAAVRDRNCIANARLIAERDRLRDSNRELLGCLKLAACELNAIRARDGAPQHVQWGANGQAFVTDACTHEWWNELTERCHAAIAKAEQS